MYDIVLFEKYGEDGLTGEDIRILYEKMVAGNQTRESILFYPIEIMAHQHESSAMGFVTKEAADKLDFDYVHSGLNHFVANILDDVNLENESNEYEFKGLKIWLSR